VGWAAVLRVVAHDVRRELLGEGTGTRSGVRNLFGFGRVINEYLLLLLATRPFDPAFATRELKVLLVFLVLSLSLVQATLAITQHCVLFLECHGHGGAGQVSVYIFDFKALQAVHRHRISTS
jgi:hypothetical protein